MKKKHVSSPPAASKEAERRSQMLLWGYGFGATLIGLGLLVLSIALGSALRSATRGIMKIPIPGRQVVSLSEGLHVAILPAQAANLSADNVDLTVAHEDGSPVPQALFPPELRQANRKIGTSLLQIQIPFDGPYAVEGRVREGGGSGEILLVHESLSSNRSDILVGVILLLVLGGFGVYILLLTRRRGIELASRMETNS